MEDKPPEPPAQSPSIASFIIGTVVGLVLGGTLLTVVLFGGVAMVFDVTHVTSMGVVYIVMYTIAALFILWMMLLRKSRLGIVAGLILGLGVGLLGGTALCQLMFTGMGASN